MWSHSQPAGQREVDKVEWAQEMLTLYAPLHVTDVVAYAVEMLGRYAPERLAAA